MLLSREYDRSIQILEIVAQACQQSEDWVRWGESQIRIAQLHYIQAAYNESLNILRFALIRGLKAMGDDIAFSARCHELMAWCYLHKGHYQNTAHYFERSLEMGKEVFGENSLFIARTNSGLGHFYLEQGKGEQAKQCLLKALGIKEQLIGERSAQSAIDLMGLGIYHSQRSELDQAITHFEKSLLLNNEIESATEIEVHLDAGLPVTGHFLVGMTHFMSRALDLALRSCEQAMSIAKESLPDTHPARALAHAGLGYCYARLELLEEALVEHNKALEIRKLAFGDVHPSISETLSAMGSCFLSLSDYDSALDHIHRALHTDQQIFGDGHVRLLKHHHLLGIGYMESAGLEKAILYFSEARRLADIHLVSGHPIAIRVYFNLAKAYHQNGEHQLAFDLAEIALKQQVKRFGKNQEQEAYIRRVLGQCRFSLGAYESAYSYFNQSHRIWESLDTINAPEERLRLLEDIGTCLYFTGELDKAIEFQERALRLAVVRLGESNPIIAQGHLSISRCYRKKGNLFVALQHCQHALSVLVPGYQKSDLYKHPALVQVSYSEALRDALDTKGQLLYDRFTIQTKNIKDLLAAHSAYESAVQLLDQARTVNADDKTRFDLARQATKTYEAAIEISVLLFYLTEQESYVQTAFQYAEKSKGLLLLSAMREAEAKATGNIPKKTIDREVYLKKEMAVLEKRISNEQFKGIKADQIKIIEWQKALFDFSKEHEELVRELETSYPEYFNLKYRVVPNQPAEIRAEIGARTLLVEYFLGDRAIYIFTITKQGMMVYTVHKPVDLEETIDEFLESIEDVIRKRFIRYACMLYDILLRPFLTEYKPVDIVASEQRTAVYTEFERMLLKQQGQDLDIVPEEETNEIEQLIIIPDGKLFFLPFETLLTERVSDKAPFTDLPYLLRLFDISYHYSATLFLFVKQREHYRSAPFNSFIGFAPVYSKRLRDQAGQNAENSKLRETLKVYSRKFKELIYSQHEVQEIAQLFYDHSVPSRTLLHSEASKGNFLYQVQDHKYVHIAAHGVQNKGRSTLSGIIFHPSHEGEAEERIVLSISEAYHLDLNADLVVLSTCESGIGALVKGEGIITINRGLLYSGAQNIIFTLFKIYDKPSFELTQLLYGFVLDGLGYSRALRKAKLQLISRPEVTPLSWSGFVLVGR